MSGSICETSPNCFISVEDIYTLDFISIMFGRAELPLVNSYSYDTDQISTNRNIGSLQSSVGLVDSKVGILQADSISKGTAIGVLQNQCTNLSSSGPASTFNGPLVCSGLTCNGSITLSSTLGTPTVNQLGYTSTNNISLATALVSGSLINFGAITLTPGVWIVSGTTGVTAIGQNLVITKCAIGISPMIADWSTELSKSIYFMSNGSITNTSRINSYLPTLTLASGSTHYINSPLCIETVNAATQMFYLNEYYEYTTAGLPTRGPSVIRATRIA